MKGLNLIKENTVLAFILIAAAILRIYHIDYQSLWLDEVYTVNLANPNFSILETYDIQTRTDGTPPLYFIIVNLVFKLFGYETFYLRMVSAVFGLAGILAIYFLGKEMFNKKIGLYASVLVTVNYFHLYYSQEARIYAFFFLVTIISFYTLVRFIKIPTLKSAILYGFGSALLLYGHYFALFTLAAQYLILLFFVVKPINVTRLKFFSFSFISGVTAMILFLPICYKAIIGLHNLDHFWAPKPEQDVYTQLFKDFFGKSEIVLFFIIILIVIYFIQLFKEKDAKTFSVNPNEEKFVFGFLILFTWILITLMLPLIRAYTTLPNLINRYFTAILPAVILILAVGLYYVRNRVIRYSVLSFIVIFSLVDILIVKHYYTNIIKDQFREVCEFVIKKNLNHEPVVSNRSWFMTYYFRDQKFNLVDKELQDYVNEMIQDSTKKTSFWYAGAGEEVAKISNEAQLYLDTNFEIENNADFYALWAKHYVNVLNPTPEFNISKYGKLKVVNGNDFVSYIDNFKCKGSEIKIEGYAFFKDQDSAESEMEIIMIGDKKAFKVQNQKVNRDDVTTWYKSQYNLGNSGFRVSLLSNNLLPGKYQLAILLRNKTTNKEGLILKENFYIKE